MASEKNKIEELVADDDDPTAELEIINFQPSESDDHTYGTADGDDELPTGQSIPELQSDLKTRTKTISRLQYDIEQLRSKWLGLESEISAREEIVANLSQEIADLRDEISRKDGLLKKRNKEITNLKSEAEQHNENQGLLEQQHADLERKLTEQSSADDKNVASLEEAERDLEDVRSKLETAQDEIETLKSETKVRDKAHGSLEQRHTNLQQQLAEQSAVDAENIEALEDAQRELEAIRTNLEAAQEDVTALKEEIKRRDETHEALDQQHTQLEQQHTELEQQDAELARLHAEQDQRLADLDKKLAEHRATDAENTAALKEAERELQNMRSRLETTRNQSAAEIGLTQQTSSAVVKEVRAQLAKAEEYADTLRYKLRDFTASRSETSKEHDRLNSALEHTNERNQELSEELDAGRASLVELQAALEQQQKDHEQEVRLLRFELSEAQDTVSDTDQLNIQLTSDLMDTRGTRSKLEHLLSENEHEAKARIDELEKHINRLSRAAEDFEQKLDTKSSAINVLLGELAKKSEQIDSIGEIEEVIQDIDDRMSERFDGPHDVGTQESVTAHTSNERDRVTRVLIGSIGDKELRFPLFKNRLTIGRTEENDIQLKESYISRNHAVVLTEGDRARVIDWGSKNGVYVNSVRIKEHFLANGDIVTVGNTKFRFEERQKRDA
jgi:epidermal growth factor receptor substrate 15